MKFPRVRFTVRRMMIVVPIAGIVLGLFLDHEARRHEYTRLRSLHWDRWMRALHEGNRLVERRTAINPNGRTAINHPDFSGPIRARADHHERLVRKYEFAARFPWLPVAPEPPDPE